jgi:hypothetical protein
MQVSIRLLGSSNIADDGIDIFLQLWVGLDGQEVGCPFDDFIHITVVEWKYPPVRSLL